MNKSFFTAILWTATLLPAWGQNAFAPAEWVNERIGTAHEGQTFPATGVPFAMTQWTPQTRAGNRKCVAPYYDVDRRIQGFRGSHFLSGSCTQDYGSVTLMPGNGALKLEEAARASSFDRAKESLKPYRYAVTLADYGIDTALTGTTRAGIQRFSFQRGGESWILVQANSAAGDGEVRIDPVQQEIVVTNPVRRLYAGNGKLAGFNGYAVVKFDRPFRVGGVWSGTEQHPQALRQAGGAGSPGAYVFFDLKPGEVVQARIGSSFTSVEEAELNLRAEIPDWNFDGVVEKAKAQWNAALGRIQIPSSATERSIFYTALYHSMLLPRVFSDADGSYPGFAGEGRVETAKGFTYYDDYSIWDTFRAVHPLLTILEPERETQMVQSLIAKGEQGGFLPIFPAWNSYTSEMVGDHAVAVIGDAYVKGLRGFDMEAAYRLMRKNATEMPATHAQYVDGRGRRALDSYLKYGYIPLEDPIADAFHGNEQVSRTLEYAYDDFVLGELAEALGKKEDAALFHRRGQNYRNVIDAGTGYARGRHADGAWIEPFDPSKTASYITESTPSIYSFFAPQDLPGLVNLLGGPKAFEQKLDAVFARGEYDHGNEPSHHLAYLYNASGSAWKTQEQVRHVLETQYGDTPEGLAGNDDCGQMSAWYVFSALGFYPVTPGTTRYEIGTPLFDKASIELEGGKRFEILAPGASSGKRYIHSAILNGKPLERSWLSHDEIVKGGTLFFEMTSSPERSWPGQTAQNEKAHAQ
jgi:predicted alpha-1,2-mannosidase